MTWIWILACGHSLLSEYPPRAGDSGYCPSCEMTLSIIGSYETAGHVAASIPPESPSRSVAALTTGGGCG